MVIQMPRRIRQNHVFGPVRSRRLGYSLGVDLVPLKTCTFDCIYCQLGRTTHKTLGRKEYIPTGAVLEELEQTLGRIPRPDYITISGSGEPTLHSGIGDVIAGIRAFTSLPVAVLTNGSLFYDETVRAACCLADVVLPSLDAGDEETFATVNRPAPGLTFQTQLEGLSAFRRDFEGQIWLEVFLVRSVTDNDTAVQRIACAVKSVRPDKVHLNTAVRPTAEEYAQPVPVRDLKHFSGFFEPRGEYIFSPPIKNNGTGLQMGQLLEMLKRRPCTLEDMARVLNMPPAGILKCLEGMIAGGVLVTVRRGTDVYYAAAPGLPPDTDQAFTM